MISIAFHEFYVSRLGWRAIYFLRKERKHRLVRVVHTNLYIVKKKPIENGLQHETDSRSDNDHLLHPISHTYTYTQAWRLAASRRPLFGEPNPVTGQASIVFAKSDRTRDTAASEICNCSSDRCREYKHIYTRIYTHSPKLPDGNLNRVGDVPREKNRNERTNAQMEIPFKILLPRFVDYLKILYVYNCFIYCIFLAQSVKFLFIVTYILFIHQLCYITRT